LRGEGLARELRRGVEKACPARRAPVAGWPRIAPDLLPGSNIHAVYSARFGMNSRPGMEGENNRQSSLRSKTLLVRLWPREKMPRGLFILLMAVSAWLVLAMLVLAAITVLHS
jgi:hypothetical protein